jgi:hypothetical protein
VIAIVGFQKEDALIEATTQHQWMRQLAEDSLGVRLQDEEGSDESRVTATVYSEHQLRDSRQNDQVC